MATEYARAGLPDWAIYRHLGDFRVENAIKFEAFATGSKLGDFKRKLCDFWAIFKFL